MQFPLRDAQASQHNMKGRKGMDAAQVRRALALVLAHSALEEYGYQSRLLLSSVPAGPVAVAS